MPTYRVPLRLLARMYTHGRFIHALSTVMPAFAGMTGFMERFYPPSRLALAEGFVLELEDGLGQVEGDRALAGPDVDRGGHAGGDLQRLGIVAEIALVGLDDDAKGGLA